jgi:uncharacterized membrane protein (UPF0127 family)
MVLMKFSFNFKGKKIVVKDYAICNNLFSKGRGLMFRSKRYSKPLLFVFSKPGRYAIHSFFCRKFIAVWMFSDGRKIKIVDEKIVNPFKASVIPSEKFNLLLEIPLRYFEFADGKGKV